MKKKIVRDISASTSQVIINQLAGIIIFYITSKYLDKSIFGEINWSLAFLITTFNILGCGIDQVIIKRIASEHSAGKVLQLFIGHTLLSSVLFYLLLAAGYLLIPSFFNQHYLLIILSVSQVLVFLALPYKQNAIGRERFRLLMIMSICSNVIRVIGLSILFLSGQLTIHNVLLIFIISSFTEWLVCILLTKLVVKSAVMPKLNSKAYLELIRESLPQLGSVIFNSAVARFDWILLGTLTTSVIMAEYSFAYKVFELSTLPLLILAPLLLPRFIRLFKNEELVLQKKDQILLLIRYEIIIACLISLILNISWVFFIDKITDGKYGAVNKYNIFLLSCTMPFLYINNILWSINFSKGNLKLIFFIITITFIINVTGDVVLIPFLKAEGAALAYLLAIIIQSIFYAKATKLNFMNNIWYLLIICFLCAFGSALLVHWFTDMVWIQLIIAVTFYFLALFLLGQIKFADRHAFKEITGI
jgi:O-antigen/teichoic acid export membrane protein